MRRIYPLSNRCRAILAAEIKSLNGKWAELDQKQILKKRGSTFWHYARRQKTEIDRRVRELEKVLS